MIRINPDKCYLCGTCVSVCPVDAIEMFEKYLKIDAEKCTACEKCVKICPVRALSMNREDIDD